MIVKLTLNTDRFIMRSLVFVRNDQTNIWPCGHAIGLPWTRSPYTLENAKATYGWCQGVRQNGRRACAAETAVGRPCASVWT